MCRRRVHECLVIKRKNCREIGLHSYKQYCKLERLCRNNHNFSVFNLLAKFVSRHEVHERTYSAERRLIKTDKTERSSLQGIEAGAITGLQTLFATALKTEP